MAESYSTSLKLTIIGAGDLAGTWGNVTNANLGTLLEQAITGVQAINISGLTTYTLTNINGALDDARNAVLVFQGGTSACTITCPGGSANKIYTVVNQGSYNITLTASGGSTSLTIPAGMAAQVYLDGTNQTGSGIGVYSLLNGVPNSFTVNGNLTATGVTDTGNLSVSGTATLSGTSTAPTPSPGDNSTKIATTAFVQTAMQILYPVGSIYTSTVSTNPASLFGFGTWVAFAAGRVLIGQDGSSFIAGATGGSADAIVVSHTHTATSTSSVSDPGHSHTFNQNTANQSGEATPCYSPVGGSGSAAQTTNSAFTGISVSTSTSISTTGSSGTNANLQPYIVVYMWNRTA
jgi:hypothetical protein